MIGPDDLIAIPAWSDEVAFEYELASHQVPGQGRECLVMRSQVILGYTVANDVTARDAMTGGPQARQVLLDTSPAGSVDHGRSHLDATNLGDLVPAWNGSKALWTL